MNKTLKTICKMLLAVSAAAAVGACDSTPTYRNPSAPVEKRIKDLMSRMTLEEKAAQLDMLSANDIVKDANTLQEDRLVHFIDSMCIGSVHDFYPKTAELANELQRHAVENSRLGIPVLFIEEGLHGYQGEGATTFPVALGNAGSWDTTLVNNIGKVIATEARAHGVHFILGPNLDLGRDPRWGRVEETFGEDVYLNSRMAVNLIKGMQGESLKASNTVAAEPKHFGIHGIPESGSNTGPVFIGEREARSTHLYIFEKAVREAGARGIMAAYHDLDGVPCIGNSWLLTDVLRDEWGFDGMVVSDLGAIRRQLDPHFTAATPKEAITKAIHAGLDMQFYDFSHEVFQEAVVEAVKDGSLPEEKFDRAVAAVLRLKFELGLFENPYTDPSLIGQVFHSPEHQALALEAGRKSIVLLKNEKNALPLDKDIKTVTLIGSLADISSIGGYSPRKAQGVTVYEALKERFGDNVKIHFIQNDISNRFTDISTSALSNKAHPEEHGLYVEYFNNTDLSGTPAYTSVDHELSYYWHNLSPAPGINPDNFSIRWTGFISVPTSGLYEFSLQANDFARMYLNNELFIDNWSSTGELRGKDNKIFMRAGQPVPIRVEYAEIDENASIGVKWRLAETSADASYFAGITRAAAASDATIVVMGETKEEVGEGKDRQNLNLRARDIEMVRAAAKSGKPIVTVLLNGRPLVFTPVVEESAAVLEAWFPGESGGTAIVDVLFGDYNPSGKLAISIPKHQGPMPVYYSRKPSSPRNYTDGNGEPLYAFGHGLSYSQFEYSNLRITPADPTVEDNITVSVDVKNISGVDGTETAQLYVRDKIGSVSTPVKALKGFSHVFLKAGETKTVTMVVKPESLALINMDMERVVEPGEFEFMVGAASDDIKLRQTVDVK